MIGTTKKSFLLTLIVVMLAGVGIVFATRASATTTSDDELTSAVTWMFENEFTFSDTLTKFNPTRSIRREEAAKFFAQFANQVLGLTGNIKLTRCNRFSDNAQINTTLKSFVVNACQLGILNGANNKIKPKDNLMNAHAIAILIRMLDPTIKDAAGANRANNYYRKATRLELLEGLTVSNKKMLISRGTVAVLLYRAAQLQSGFTDVIVHTGSVSTGTLRTGADLIISSIALDTGHTDPTVGDELAYFKLKIKNIGYSNFSGQSNLYPPLTLRCTGSNHMLITAASPNTHTGAAPYNYTIAPQQTFTFAITTLRDNAILATGGMLNAECYLALATGFVDINTGNNDYDFGFEILE